MNVRFMDTSIVMNLLEIPGKCQDAEKIKEEFKQVIEDREILILSMATIVESGNHIAHINDGRIRREKAIRFQEFLRKTANEEAPWILYGLDLSKEDLLIIAEEFPERALRLEMGIGDLSIIRFYEKYKNDVPAVGRIMIWSTDHHLSCYSQDLTMKRRKSR